MSYIIVELDTTSPTIEIYSPSYTTREAEAEIQIQANEQLDNWQETYIIDGNGVRHDYTFLVQEKELIGIVSFNNMPVGLATLYVTVRDDVNNVSEKYSKIITIKESLNLLKLEIEDFSRKMIIDDKSRTIDISEKV